MCLAVPGQIVELDGNTAVVDFQGNRMEVCTIMTPDVRPEDWVLVHAGFSISQLDEQAARETWSYLDQMFGEEGNEGPDDAEDTDNGRNTTTGEAPRG